MEKVRKQKEDIPGKNSKIKRKSVQKKIRENRKNSGKYEKQKENRKITKKQKNITIGK